MVHRYYIDGGFAQVRDDVVTVLTPRSLKAEEINPEAVRQALQAAEAPEAQQRARAQLRVAMRID